MRIIEHRSMYFFSTTSLLSNQIPYKSIVFTIDKQQSSQVLQYFIIRYLVCSILRINLYATTPVDINASTIWVVYLDICIQLCIMYYLPVWSCKQLSKMTLSIS